MSIDFSGCAELIQKIVDEARTRNYPNHVLHYDLNQFLHDVYADQAEEFQQELRWAVENAEEETRDNCYSDAYDEGLADGFSDARDKFVKLLADKMIELKRNIQCGVLQGKDLQIALTELVVAFDEDNILYGNEENTLRDFDN